MAVTLAVPVSVTVMITAAGGGQARRHDLGVALELDAGDAARRGPWTLIDLDRRAQRLGIAGDDHRRRSASEQIMAATTRSVPLSLMTGRPLGQADQVGDGHPLCHAVAR